MVEYVDDRTLIRRDVCIFENGKSWLRQKFILKDLGRASELVEIAIVYDDQRGTLFLNQANTIRRCLTQFKTVRSKQVSSPREQNVGGAQRSDPEPITDVPYRDTIGFFTVLHDVHTADITYAAGTLAKIFEAPNTVHWEMVKRVSRYLRGTEETQLVYCRTMSQSGTEPFVGYSDAERAGLPCSKSTSGSTLFYKVWLV